MSTIKSLTSYYADAGGSCRQDCRQVGILMSRGVENNNAEAQLAVSETLGGVFPVVSRLVYRPFSVVSVCSSLMRWAVFVCLIRWGQSIVYALQRISQTVTTQHHNPVSFYS